MYHIKVLSSKEFDEVAKSDPRYSKVDETNLGFADHEKKTAYVKYTAYPQLNKYLIDHEFEHLLETEGTDEDENGIRHKKFFKELFMPFIDPLNTLGTRGGHPFAGAGDALLGGLTGAIGGPGGAIAGAVGSSLNQARQKSQSQKMGGFSQDSPQFGGSGLFDSFSPDAFSPMGGGGMNSQMSTQQGLNQGLFPGGSGFRPGSQPNITMDPRQKEAQYGSPFGRPYYF